MTAMLKVSAPRPWAEAPRFAELARQLDPVLAVDNHTHLLETGPFDPSLDAMFPLLLRSGSPGVVAVLRDRFDADPGAGVAAAATHGAEVRRQRLERLGHEGYWADHLDHAGVETVLVNQGEQEGTDSARLRWVPHATRLLHPLPYDGAARNPKDLQDVVFSQQRTAEVAAELGADRSPSDLEGYLGFVDRVLRHWRSQGAVALKFWDAYLRTLRIEDVAEEDAAALYERGREQPLSHRDYVALQDFVWRHIVAQGGELGMPIHIHSSHGIPPFLRATDSDVRNLDLLLTDPRYFATDVVLIHGGAPLCEEAAYLALKPHVWVDVSAMPFLYPVPDLAAALRLYLRYAPTRCLFGTDAAAYPTVPVGPEVQHIALCRAVRDGLYLALAGLVEDATLTMDAALAIGRGVLRDNARRMYRWDDGE
jgi:predicted TIM-barrel fold metal-dependent hydrolase